MENKTTEDEALQECESTIPEANLMIDPHAICIISRSTQLTRERNKKWCIPIFPGLGLILGVIAGIFFGFSTLVVKMTPNVHAMMLLLIRSITQIIFFVPFAIQQRLSLPTKFKEELVPLCGRSIFGTIGIASLYFSVKMIPMADATTIAFSSPVFVSIFACLFLKEPCGIFHSVMVVIALSGVVLVSKPTFIFGGSDTDSLLRLEGSMVALLCSFSQGFVYISLRKLKNVPAATVIIVFSATSLVVSGLVLITIQDTRYPACGQDAILVMMGAICACVGQLCMTSAAQIEFAGPLSLVRTTDIFMAFILQVSVLGHFPTWNSIIGAVVILLCVLAIGLKKWSKERPELFQPVKNLIYFRRKDPQA